MDIDESLKQVLEDQVSAINGMEDGSAEKTAAVKELEIVNRVYLERMSAVTDYMQKESEVSIAEESAKHENRDKIIGHIFEGVKIAGVATLIVGSTIIGYKFEETGTQTSQTFKRIQDWIWKFTKM